MASQVHPSLITILPASNYTELGGLDVHIEFKCSNCGLPHTMIEYVSRMGIDFSTVSWALPCGRVTVKLPWASGRPTVTSLLTSLVRSDSSNPKGSQ